jgi:hypothetical protein
MNTDEGIYDHDGAAPKYATTLSVGEVVKIKGEDHRVTEIKDRKVTLELMSLDDRLDEVVARSQNRHERRVAEVEARRRNG